MSRAEVGIIGAGPAGLAAAIQLRRRGVDRVVIVDRHDFPRDKTCGSAVSPKGIEVLKALDVFEAVSARSLWIRGMRLVTPNGREVRMIGEADAALICNRRIFDAILLRRAQAAGAEFRPNVDVDHLLFRDDRVAGFRGRDGSSVAAAYTIVADGAKSRFGLDRGPRRALQTIMGWWDGLAHRPEEIEMIFDPLVSPLYGWLFPEGAGRVNIGICYEDPGLDKNGRSLFAAFLDKHFAARIADAAPVGTWKGHPISYSAGIGRLTSPGRFVVGEAARMTHPATGEGIYQAMMSGMAAADAIAEALLGKVPEAEAARRYRSACRTALGASFRVGMGWRRLVSAGGLDVAARMTSTPLVRKVLAQSMAHM